MKKLESNDFKSEIKNLVGFLRAKGISQSMIDQIRIAFVNEAMAESSNMKYDRIYTAIALMLRRAYGFGHVRIFRGMNAFGDIMSSVAADDAKEWEELMAELDDETGIVIRTDCENRDRLVCEYMGKTWRRVNQISEAERREQMDKCESML